MVTGVWIGSGGRQGGAGTLPRRDRRPDQSLLELAAKHGVATDYWDWQGRPAPISAETIEAVLAALGVPAHTPDEVEAALREVGDRFWRRTLPATVVTREGWAPWVFVHVPDGTGAR